MADWTDLFTGVYDGHELKVSFLDSFVLTQLYSEDKNNLVINVVYVGYANGDLESFAETLPKDNLLYLSHNSNKTDKFFCLTVPSIVISNNKIEIDKEITKQIQSLLKIKKVVFDIAETYDIKMDDINNASKKIQSDFFINPLTIFKLLQTPSEMQKISDVKLDFGHTITLGKYKTSGELTHDEIDAFRKTIILGKQEYQLSLIYNLAEELSLGAIPVLIFDSEKKYLGLKEANHNANEVKQFNPESEPTGFPIETLFYDGSDKSNIWADLSLISLDGFLDLFKITNQYKEIFKRAKENNPDDFSAYIDFIDRVTPDEQIKEYDIGLAKRMANILKINYPNLFKGKLSLTGVDKILSNKIGKINIISISGSDIEKNLVIESILKSFKSKENIAFIIPDAYNFCPKNVSLTQNEICNCILSCNGYFVLSANNSSDLNDNILKYKSSQIDIIGEDDVALKVGNSSPYRISLRPSLSNKNKN